MQKKPAVIALRITLLYAIATGAWIFLSSKGLILLLGDPSTILVLEVYKGWVFVAVSSALLFIVLSRQLRRGENEAAGRKQAEELLRRHEEHMRAMLSAAQDGFWLVDMNGKILEANDAACTISGYSRDELVGMNLSDLDAAETRSEMEHRFEDIIKAGSVRFETLHRRKDGQIIQVEASVTYIQQNGGRFVTSYRDITRKKEAEDALIASEERFRRYFELGLIGMAITSPTKGCLEVNDEFCRILGYEREELLRMNWAELTYADDLPSDVANFNRVVSGEIEGYAMEKRWVRKDGAIVDSEISVKCVRTMTGAVDYFVGLVHDITERKRAEGALRASEAQLSNALTISHMGHWEYDIASDLYTFNDHFYAVFRTSAQEAGGYTMSAGEYARRFVDPRDASIVGSEIQKVLQSTDPNYSGELEHRVLYGDGTVGVIVVRFFVVHDIQGKPVKIYGANQDITERRKAEAQLMESEERFRQLAGSINEVFWMTDLAKRVMLYISPAYEAVWGRSCASLYANPEAWLEAIHPDDRDRVIADSVPAESAWSFEIEYRIIRPDGAVRWIRDRAFPVRDESGRVFRISGIAEDITERKEAKEALQQAKEFAESIIQSANVIFVQLDVHGTVLKVNKAAEVISGYSAAELEGSNWFEKLVPRSQYPYVWQTFNRLKNRGELPLIIENPILTKDGQERQILWKNAVLRNDEKRYCTISFGMDISERKQSERVLRESEERFSKVFAASPVGITITTPAEGRFIDINDAALSMFGYEREDLIGRTVYDLGVWVDPEDRTVLTRALQERHKLKQLETRMRTRQGEIRNFLLSSELIIVGGDQCLLNLLVDITERKRAEEQVAASLREKEVLLKEIHHRVKNNLQIISSLLNLQSSRVEDESLKAIFQESRQRVRAMAIVHERLYRSHNFARVNFAEYIQTVTGELFRSFSKPAVNCSLEVEPIFLQLDMAIPCGLIVNELVTNALKHAFPGERAGSVTVALRRHDSTSVELTVTDDGVGFPPDKDIRESGSMGMELVVSLSDQISGALSLKRESGTSVAIRFAA